MEVSSWWPPLSARSRASSRQHAMPPAPCPQLALGMDRAEQGSWVAASRAHRPVADLTHTSHVCGARNLRELTKSCKQQLLPEVGSRQKIQDSFSCERQLWQQQQLENEHSSGPQWELAAAYMHLQLPSAHFPSTTPRGCRMSSYMQSAAPAGPLFQSSPQQCSSTIWL